MTTAVPEWNSTFEVANNGIETLRNDTFQVQYDQPDVYYDNEYERVFSSLFIALSGVFTTCSQLLVLVTIAKHETLHNIHFCLIAMYCCTDLVITFVSVPSLLRSFITEQPPARVLCRVMSSTTISCVLGLVCHTALIAMERYMFFCKPFEYSKWVNKVSVTASLVLCYAVPITFTTVQEILSGRVFHASNLTCLLEEGGVSNVLQTIFIVLPAMVITVFCMAKVWKITKRAFALPHDGVLSISPAVQAKKGLRMVLLLSGTFWASTLPATLARIIILNMGFTWQDLDTRRYPAPAIITRITTFIYCVISSAINPLIYYYSRKDLRDATRKMIWGRRSTEPHISNVSATISTLQVKIAADSAPEMLEDQRV